MHICACSHTLTRTCVYTQTNEGTQVLLQLTWQIPKCVGVLLVMRWELSVTLVVSHTLLCPQIYGTNSSVPEQVTLCGAVIPDPVFLSSNTASLHFHTDSSRQHIGYDITYVATSEGLALASYQILYFFLFYLENDGDVCVWCMWWVCVWCGVVWCVCAWYVCVWKYTSVENIEHLTDNKFSPIKSVWILLLFDDYTRFIVCSCTFTLLPLSPTLPLIPTVLPNRR